MQMFDFIAEIEKQWTKKKFVILKSKDQQINDQSRLSVRNIINGRNITNSLKQN